MAGVKGASAGETRDLSSTCVDEAGKIRLDPPIWQHMWGAACISPSTVSKDTSHLERRIGGIRAGSSGYVWRVGPVGDRLLRNGRDQPGTARRKEPSARFLDHTLAVADTALSLLVASRSGRFELLAVTPEPATWRRYLGPGGSREILKPDLTAVTASGDYEDAWFIEVDRGTESLPTLLGKCLQYERYRRTGREQQASCVFPRVVWILPTTARAEQLTAALRRSHGLDPALYRITTGEGFIEVIAGGAA